MSSPESSEIEKAYREVQEEICTAIERADGAGRFNRDEWQRPEGGGGLTRIMQGGQVIEKGGVNFSAVSGPVTQAMAQSMQVKADSFFATGVSIVMHPQSPMVPIIHMNIRYFETDRGEWWFGGGIDLTPHYVDSEQAAWFHKQLQALCDDFDPAWYHQFKAWADDYFFIPHRNETRGVGGIFYDHINAVSGHSKEEIFRFSVKLGMAFPIIYSYLIGLNRHLPHTPGQKDWQLMRRGRYVEFNLVYDRGTRFGLLSQGRTESILMSLPRDARWIYDHQVEPGSPEASTLALLRKGVDWNSKG